MEKGDIDTYIATFMKLLGQAGYQATDQGALTLFKWWLPAPLNICIINNTTPIPSTLEGWKTAAREQQLCYLQTQEFSEKHLSQAQQSFACSLGLNNQGQHPKKHPDAIDIDGTQTQTRCFNPLTEEEKKDLMSYSACFRCH